MRSVCFCLFVLISCSFPDATSVPKEISAKYHDALDSRLSLAQREQLRLHYDDYSAFHRDGDKLVYDLSWLHDPTWKDGDGTRWQTFGTFNDQDIWHTDYDKERDERLRASLAETSANMDLSDTGIWPVIPRGTQKLPGLTNPSVYIISLPGAVLRRKRLAEHVASLGIDADFHWFPAVDGRLIADDLVWANQTKTPPLPSRKGRGADQGKYGCYLSHQFILEQTQEHEGDLIIFEDDNMLHPEFVEKWSLFSTAMPLDWDIVLLGSNMLPHVPFYETKNYIRTTFSWGANAYIIRDSTRPTLLRLLQTNRNAIPYDVILGQVNILKPPDKPMMSILPQFRLAQTSGEVHSTEELSKIPQYRDHVDLEEASWVAPYRRSYCKLPTSRRFCSSQVEAAWQQLFK